MPSNMHEFYRFSEYISKDADKKLDNISFEDLNKFDSILKGMPKDGYTFEEFNKHLEDLEMPDNLKDIVKKASVTKLDIDKEIEKQNKKDDKNIDVKKENDKIEEHNIKYFLELASTDTEEQKEAKKEEQAEKQRKKNPLEKDTFISKDLFADTKSGVDKYKEFILKMKYEVDADAGLKKMKTEKKKPQ